MSPDDTSMQDSVAHSDTELARVILGDLAAPLVEVSPVSYATIAPEHRVMLDSEQRMAISAALAQLPGLLQTGHTALAQTYQLVFKPEAIAKMANLMRAHGGGVHAIALNAQGKIVGQGILKGADGARTFAGATALWQGLSIITSQIHLVEINARLAQIERGIDTIKAWLEAEQLAVLEVGLRYVREASVALTQDALRHTERERLADQLEHIWRDCGQIARTTLAIMQRAPGDFGAIQLSVWNQLDASADLALATLSGYARAAKTYLLATSVRAATIALGAQLNLSPAVTRLRCNELREDIADWCDAQKPFFQIFKQRVHTELYATLYRQLTNAAARRRVLATARQARLELEEACANVAQWVQQAPTGAAIAADEPPHRLVVSLDAHGQVVEAYYTPAPQRATVTTARRRTIS